MKRCLSVLLALILTVWTQATPAEAGLASCRFDTSINGTGFTVITPDPGWYVDRMAIDSQGRLYMNILYPNAGGDVIDRIRRYTPEGELDLTFASNGNYQFPSDASTGYGRVLAVDDLDRLWFARPYYPELIRVERFIDPGIPDPVFPDLEIPAPFGTWDPVGAMVGDGGTVTIAHGVFDGIKGAPVISHVDNNGVATTTVPSSPWTGIAPFIHDVTVDGWLAGAALPASNGYNEFHGYAWNSNYPDYEPYFSDLEDGSFLGVHSEGATAIVYGGTGAAFPGGAIVQRLEADDQDQMIQGTDGAFTWFDGGVGEVAHVSDDGNVIGFNGSEGDQSLFLGTLRSDMTVSVGESQTGLAQALGPIEVRELADGTTMVAGYHDYENSELFLARLLPETAGPVVSPSALSDQLIRLYQAYFLRAPDSDGLNYWRGQRAGGLSIEQVSGRFAAAPEFQQRYGALSNQQFVELVYTNVLSRPPDSAGRAYWTAQLDTGTLTRGEVMLGFSESRENIETTGTSAPHSTEEGSVARLYQAYFGRAPDASGLCYWSRQLVDGLPLDDVSGAFAGSAEFNRIYGALTDRSFVELIYQNVLGRSGEPAGVDFWTSELANNRRTRGQVMARFSESAEFVLRTGTLPS